MLSSISFAIPSLMFAMVSYGFSYRQNNVIRLSACWVESHEYIEMEGLSMKKTINSITIWRKKLKIVKFEWQQSDQTATRLLTPKKSQGKAELLIQIPKIRDFIKFYLRLQIQIAKVDISYFLARCRPLHLGANSKEKKNQSH